VSAILRYVLFCCLVIVAVIGAIGAGYPVRIVATLGVWTVSLGAIVTVVRRAMKRLR